MNDENEAKNYIIDKVLGFVRQTDQHHLPKGTPLSSFYFTSEAVVCICLCLVLPFLFPPITFSFFYLIFIFCILILFYTVWFDSWPENFQFVHRIIWPFLWHRTFWVLASWIRFKSNQHCQCCFRRCHHFKILSNVLCVLFSQWKCGPIYRFSFIGEPLEFISIGFDSIRSFGF